MAFEQPTLSMDAGYSGLHNKALIALGAILGLTLSEPAFAQSPSYDLILRNARIVDGTGNPSYRADLAIRGETIARITTSIVDLRRASTTSAGR